MNLNKNDTMKELPREQQPYEKCLRDGPEVLSDSELLAVILRSGTRGLLPCPCRQNPESYKRYLLSRSFGADAPVPPGFDESKWNRKSKSCPVEMHRGVIETDSKCGNEAADFFPAAGYSGKILYGTAQARGAGAAFLHDV